MSIEIMKQVREAFRLCVPMDGYHAEVDAVFKRLDQAIGNAEPQTSLWKEYWMDILKENNDLHERIAKAEKQEQDEPVSKNQWWAKELEGFWGSGDYEVTLDTRRAAKTALTIIFDTTPQPKQEQGEPVAWMEEGWGPDCGPYIEFYRDDEMGWRDRKEWTPLYTTPYVPTGRQPAPQRSEDTMQQKPWVGLTDEEVDFIADKHATLQGAIWAIEAKLKEKNT